MTTANTERSNHSLAGLKAGGSGYEYQICHCVFLCKTSHRSRTWFCLCEQAYICWVWLAASCTTWICTTEGEEALLVERFLPCSGLCNPSSNSLPKPFPVQQSEWEIHGLNLMHSLACPWREVHVCAAYTQTEESRVLPCLVGTTGVQLIIHSEDQANPVRPSKSLIGISKCVIKVDFIS